MDSRSRHGRSECLRGICQSPASMEGVSVCGGFANPREHGRHGRSECLRGICQSPASMEGMEGVSAGDLPIPRKHGMSECRGDLSIPRKHGRNLFSKASMEGILFSENTGTGGKGNQIS